MLVSTHLFMCWLLEFNFPTPKSFDTQKPRRKTPESLNVKEPKAGSTWSTNEVGNYSPPPQWIWNKHNLPDSSQVWFTENRVGTLQMLWIRLTRPAIYIANYCTGPRLKEYPKSSGHKPAVFSLAKNQRSLEFAVSKRHCHSSPRNTGHHTCTFLPNLLLQYADFYRLHKKNNTRHRQYNKRNVN